MFQSPHFFEKFHLQHIESIAKTCLKTYSLCGENFVTLQLKHFYRKAIENVLRNAYGRHDIY